ncbi:MAG: hypothetical protein JWO32_319 [Bacteroidetes bacterium]|nr:hypothetical protein [Bacteroidota bacterium]
MKKIIASLMLALTAITSDAQTQVTDFESFTLTPNSFYKDTNSVPFQSAGSLFRHQWTNGSFAYWSGGFSYTNKTDTTNGNYNNIYNCRAYKGYNNSAKYATGQDRATLVLKAPYDRVDGFYITNTNYAYKSMKFGDSFAKKFGGTSGNDPDFFKITAKGYLNGAMKPDSAVYYLADYRFTSNSLDYILESWQWFNTSSLGQVDSIRFFMNSSDVGQFGINTPLFFSMDNLTVTDAFVGIPENNLYTNIHLFPNPFTTLLNIETDEAENIQFQLFDVFGKELIKENLESGKKQINLSFLQSGVYFAEIKSENFKVVKKIIKN